VTSRPVPNALTDWVPSVIGYSLPKNCARDGVGDDANAFEDTVGSLIANSSSADPAAFGGTIWVSPGTYRLARKIDIGTGGIVFRGTGDGPCVILADHAEPALDFAPTGALATLRENGVYGLRFRTTVTDRIGAVAIRMTNCVAYGIGNVWGSGRHEAVIDLFGCLQGTLSQIRIDSPINAGPAGPKYGVRMQPSSASGCNKNLLYSVDAENCNEAGFYIAGNASLNSYSNTLMSCMAQGCNGDGMQLYKTICTNLISHYSEDNGRDGASGRAHIRDISVSGATGHRALTIQGGTLGGKGATAHADFCTVKLVNAVAPTVRGIYFASGSKVHFDSDAVFGLVVRDNWSLAGEPTFVEVPVAADVDNNFDGVTGTPWS
jgi:hypothetical protein